MAAYILIGCVILILDQLSKYFFLNLLSLNQSIPVIKNMFHLTLVYNTGCAFGLLKNQGWYFIIISLLVIFFILFYWIKELKYAQGSKILKLSLVLILSGAIGNLIDRLRFGYVIDFLDFRIWPVFNLADSAITIGVILICIRLSLKLDR